MSSSSREELSDAERALLETLRTMNYGALEITVHDARIVQIQKTEKMRFPGGPKG
ncbi:MAG: YezD family protein [Alphaproteobacteria bacterium]